MAVRRTRLKQLAKRIPGVQTARRRVLRSVRNNPSARSLVRKVFAVEANSLAPLDVAPGRVLGGVGAESLPVTLVVIVGADADTVARTVDEVAQLQLMSAGFRPVIVTDRPVFDATRRYGYPCELLVDRESWDSATQRVTWDEYARSRLSLLTATYRATASVTVGSHGLDQSARLVLNSLRSEPAQS